MNYLSIEKLSVANGKGARTVLWVSGCSLHCKGCHNPESWDFNAGQLFDADAKNKLFEYLSKPYIQGLTISGGHPLDPPNTQSVYELLLEVRKKFPTKDIWLYTGLELTYDDSILYPWKYTMPKSEAAIKLVQLCDVVVDGKYIEELRDTTLPFRGSSNQRLIDIKSTLAAKEIVLYDKI